LRKLQCKKPARFVSYSGKGVHWGSLRDYSEAIFEIVGYEPVG
jgi:hypothetical protein